jgi:Ca-activated chloride channel family protein
MDELRGLVEGFRFEEPLWLLATTLGPLLVLMARWRERRASSVLFPGVARLAAVKRRGRAALRHVPLLCAALGLVLAAVAQARPQQGSVRENVTTQGVDIVVSLDVSGSMAAEDFQPKNRLEVAKDVVAEFFKRRTQDRVGLVIFAGRSLTKAPPTTDTALLLRQLEDVKLDQLPDGTAIGSGMATALTRLRRSKAESRVMVLVTDGANNAGEIDPGTATDLARALGVRVYTVLVGRGGEVPMPVSVRDPLTGQVYKRTVPVNVQIDPALLKRIAERTGGEFFEATDPESLRSIFERIDRLEKSEIKLTTYRRYRELFPPVLAAAAAFFALGGLLWAVGWRVVPA